MRFPSFLMTPLSGETSLIHVPDEQLNRRTFARGAPHSTEAAQGVLECSNQGESPGNHADLKSQAWVP